MIRTEECVCGAQLRAPADDWQAIGAMLRIHYGSARHGTDPRVASQRAARRRAERRVAALELQLVRARRGR